MLRSNFRSREEAGWSNPKVLSIFALIFLSGALLGAFGMRSFLHMRMPASAYHTMDAARAVPMSRLTVLLQLTPEQEQKIAYQLDDYGKYYQNIEEERADVARHGVQAIMQCLSDSQKRRFEKLFGTKR